jgi:streptogramin lyase
MHLPDTTLRLSSRRAAIGLMYWAGALIVSGCAVDTERSASVNPAGIVSLSDGSLYITGPASVAKISTNGEIKHICEIGSYDFVFFDSIVVGPDGNLWFASPRSGRIGRLSLH